MNPLDELVTACREAACCFYLNYCEPDNSFEIEISSAAPSEYFRDKRCSTWEEAVKGGLDWVRRLK